MNIVIIDRDGVINELVLRETYQGARMWASPLHPDDVRLVHGAAHAIKDLNDAGYYVYCVTDAMVAYHHGECTMSDALRVHAAVFDLLRAEGARVDQTYICQHASNAICDCRKPGLASWRALSPMFTRDDVWVIGDSDSDIRYGQAISAKTISYVSNAWHKRSGTAEADHTVVSLNEAVSIILEER